MNILGFNIGQNYKGILNLGSTINSPLSGTLQAVTDGMGVASPLQLSNTQVVYSGNTLNTLVFGAFNSTRTDGIGFFNSNSDSTPVWSLRAGNDCRVQMYSNEITFRAGGTNIVKLFPSSMGIGNPDAYTPSARLHVRGDGTNPIARFENSTGAALLIGTGAIGNRIWSSNSSSATLDINIGGAVLTGQWITGQGHSFQVTNVTMSQTSGTSGSLLVGNTFAAGAGSANYRPIQVEYTINNSGAQTGTATGIFLNATETALNGMTHNLMDLQVGGVSRFRVGNAGNVICGGINSASSINCSTGGAIFWESRSFMRSPADGLIRLSNYAETDFNRLQFGGTTNAFPALKRSSAELQVRLADDSGFASLQVGEFRNNGNFNIYRTDGYYVLNYGNSGNVLDFNPSNGSSLTIRMRGQTALNLFYIKASEDRIGIGTDTPNASAILDISTTTKGFLPPRQTEAQRLAISSPAVGLIVYQTDASDGLYVYKTGGWTLII